MIISIASSPFPFFLNPPSGCPLQPSCSLFLFPLKIYSIQLVLPTLTWFPPEHGFPQQQYPPQNDIPPKQPSTASSSLAGVGINELLPHHVEMLTGLILCSSCSGKHSGCEVMGAMAVPHPEASISWLSSPSSCSYTLSSPFPITFAAPG